MSCVTPALPQKPQSRYSGPGGSGPYCALNRSAWGFRSASRRGAPHTACSKGLGPQGFLCSGGRVVQLTHCSLGKMFNAQSALVLPERTERSCTGPGPDSLPISRRHSTQEVICPHQRVLNLWHCSRGCWLSPDSCPPLLP